MVCRWRQKSDGHRSSVPFELRPSNTGLVVARSEEKPVRWLHQRASKVPGRRRKIQGSPRFLQSSLGQSCKAQEGVLALDGEVLTTHSNNYRSQAAHDSEDRMLRRARGSSRTKPRDSEDLS